MEKECIDFVKMSSKGQLVVPQDVRTASHLTPGERFAAFPVEGGVLFKKVEMPKIKLDFKSLAKDVEAQFRKYDVKENDVKEAVKWARRR